MIYYNQNDYCLYSLFVINLLRWFSQKQVENNKKQVLTYGSYVSFA